MIDNIQRFSRDGFNMPLIEVQLQVKHTAIKIAPSTLMRVVHVPDASVVGVCRDLLNEKTSKKYICDIKRSAKTVDRYKKSKDIDFYNYRGS